MRVRALAVRRSGSVWLLSLASLVHNTQLGKKNFFVVTLTKHLKETIDLFGLMVSEGSALRGKEGVGVAEYT